MFKILKTEILPTVTATTHTIYFSRDYNICRNIEKKRTTDTMTVDANVHVPLFQIVVAATPDGGIGRGMNCLDM